ncbi:hypothetical protein BJ508DRAFT_330335 [Ascobolus immersus RN42]|uniref:Uncharacterized protein n=1 Tax=Ascobolus immersus RN42 TaxID=1160509 RepID=A0A3N4HVW8_ASCIM|nr:hypothetical protein BJ508DRAFT_330335 [Ascobolus immersus RN42]
MLDAGYVMIGNQRVFVGMPATGDGLNGVHGEEVSEHDADVEVSIGRHASEQEMGSAGASTPSRHDRGRRQDHVNASDDTEDEPDAELELEQLSDMEGGEEDADRGVAEYNYGDDNGSVNGAEFLNDQGYNVHESGHSGSRVDDDGPGIRGSDLEDGVESDVDSAGIGGVEDTQFYAHGAVNERDVEEYDDYSTGAGNDVDVEEQYQDDFDAVDGHDDELQ